MIKPTVGRIVWYWPESGETIPLAAIITRVWSDSCVNLAIFGPDGNPIPDPPTSVSLLAENELPPASGRCCSWMPYQLAQAKPSNN